MQYTRAKTAAQFEEAIRAGRYASYTAACVALSKSTVLSPAERESLKGLASEVIKTRATRPVESYRVPRRRGFPSDPLSAPSSRAGQASAVRVVRRRRDALLLEIARLDTRLSGHDDKVALDAAVCAVEKLADLAVPGITAGWADVRRLSSAEALELVRLLCAGDTVGAGHASRAVALLAVALVRSGA